MVWCVLLPKGHAKNPSVSIPAFQNLLQLRCHQLFSLRFAHALSCNLALARGYQKVLTSVKAIDTKQPWLARAASRNNSGSYIQHQA